MNDIEKRKGLKGEGLETPEGFIRFLEARKDRIKNIVAVAHLDDGSIRALLQPGIKIEMAGFMSLILQHHIMDAAHAEPPPEDGESSKGIDIPD